MHIPLASSFMPRLAATAAALCLASLSLSAQAGLVTVADLDFNGSGCAGNAVGAGAREIEKKASDIRLSQISAGNCAVLLDKKDALLQFDWVIADTTRLTLQFETLGAGGSGNNQPASKQYLSMWWGVVPDWQTSVIIDQLGYTEFTRVTTTGRVSEFVVQGGQTVRLQFQAAEVAAFIDNLSITYDLASPTLPVADPGGDAHAVPEPASLLLVATAGLGLLGSRQRRRRD